MRRILVLAVLVAACVASLPSAADEAAVNLGKRRAAASEVEWDLRDANHPLLGQIRFTARKKPAVTIAPGGRIVSQAYVSCQKSSGRIAIELTNALESNLAGGLSPKQAPRLTCYSTDLRDDSMGIREIPAKWATNELGDAMARGLSPADLRRCISIEILQEVMLPAGSGSSPASQGVVLELLPYDRSFDAVVVACKEKTAYEAAKAPIAAPAPRAVAPPSPASAPPPASAASAATWRNARTAPKGQTNVRAGPGLATAIVRKLDPGTPLQVQPAKDDWWRVKSARGAAFGGYVREDRLVIE